MSDQPKLPPIDPETLKEGYKETTTLNFVRCPHKNAKIFSSTELRCTCGANWHGPNILELYNLLTK